MKSLIVYISGPYSATTREARWNNVLEAVKVGIEIRAKGHYPIIPHLYDEFDEVAKMMGHNFDWQSYMDMDLAILERCDCLYFIGESKGACIELERAKELGLQIFYSLEEVPECGVGEWIYRSEYNMPVYWEYEDRLPKVRPSEFGVMYPLSRIIGGVRMYPYILDEEGERVYIGFGSRGGNDE